MSENCGETCHLVATSSHGCNLTGVSLDAGKILTQNSLYIYIYVCVEHLKRCKTSNSRTECHNWLLFIF